MKKVFIAGCGYIGKRVAMLCRQAGIEVTCMVRSAEHAAELTLAGYRAIVCSLDSPLEAPLPDLGDSVLYYFVPPPGGGNVDRRARNFCAAMAHQGEPPQKIVYISATSVYSARDGSVVTEQSPTVPLSVMGKRRVDAENAFQEYASAVSVPLVILRVSGIYGPGRLPLMQIRQNQPLLTEEEAGPSNRIHADDLAAICLAAADRGDNEIFNISDGHPCSLTSYFNAVCDALGEPRQPQVNQEEARKVMTPLMLSYFSETRIVDNSLMLKRLGISLGYPEMLDGIKASIGTVK